MRRPGIAALRYLLLASASAVAGACATTRYEGGPVRETLPSSSGRDGEIRLAMKDGSEVHLFDARIVGDSVVGSSLLHSDAAEYRVAVAKDDVVAVAVRKGDTFKTVLAVAGGAFAAVFIVAAITCLSYVAA